MKTIQLTQGKVALVDDDDFVELCNLKWQFHAGYAKHSCTVNGRNTQILMHRAICKPSQGQCIDHINGDGLDNRRSNLRLASNTQNKYNQRKYKNAKNSKWKGVCLFRKNPKPWRARITVDKKSIWLGSFNIEEEAAAAYDAAARKYFGEFARTNFPE